MKPDASNDTIAFGLIGYPLGHSWSKQYFEKKFARLGLQNYSYSLFPCQSANALPEIIEAHPGLRGLNVTIPHKQAVIPFLSSLSDTARAIGAVNTLLIERLPEGISVRGDNTDAWGFAQSLHKYGISPEQPGEPALVLGTGGASQAVAWVLLQEGWSVVRVTRCRSKHSKKTTQRHHDSMHLFASAHHHQPAPEASGSELLCYEEIRPELFDACRLIINTTPLGMYPNTDTLPPIPYQHLNSRHILYDLVYNPPQTRFMEMGLAAGCTIIGGLDMLIMQAEKSWEIWTQQGNPAG